MSASNDALIISTLEPARHSVCFCGFPFGLSIFLYLPLNRQLLFASWWFSFPLRSSLFSPPFLAFPLLFATSTSFNAPSNTVSSSLLARRHVSEALRLSVTPRLARLPASLLWRRRSICQSTLWQRQRHSALRCKRQEQKRKVVVTGNGSPIPGCEWSQAVSREKPRPLPLFCRDGGIPAI